MEMYDRQSKFTELSKYCHHSKDADYMELTEWKNGEGWDVTISSRSRDVSFSLTYGEFDCLQALISYKG